MPALIPIVITAAAVGSAAIVSSGASKAAKTQAEAQQKQIEAQERAAEQERQERAAALGKEEAARQEAVKRKEEAVKNIKYPTYLETATAPLLRQTLEDKLAGRGLAAPVSPLDIDKLTAPFAKQRRAGLVAEEAAISSAASARGLGRSTIPVAQIGLSSQAAERDIEERVANLMIENKKIEEANIERERAQKESALTGYERLTGAESATQREKAQFERGGEFEIAETIAGNAAAIGKAERDSAAIFRENQFAIADSIEKKGATEAAYELKQAEIWGSALAGVAKSATQSSEDVINAIREEKGSRNRAMVNIGGRTQSVPVRPY